MLKKLMFLMKVGYKILKKDVINNEDYRKEYNNVAKTYNLWLKEMGRFTDEIINVDYINENKKLKILDFACGTGYITKELLQKNIDCEITSVDFSEKMLDELKRKVGNKANIIHSDGLEFLKNTKEKYDIIYFGWALSYFNYREIFKLFKEVLKENGIVCIITNTKGTLNKIEDIFLSVMSENQSEVNKPMDIKFNLPKGKNGLIKWINEFGFEEMEVKEGEVVFYFETPDEVLKWINKTGAAAGTVQIFKDYNKIKYKLIDKIKKEKYNNGKYEINHRFAYGIFKVK